ncbi:unnamed protein product [Clonostachys rhizophaga]|uniref:Uncharacterized protein n=1 Tax=Clonostachys rhizophaga TaxID=160324 RepID=A0A9N9V4P4_9HYPO|nr:unnamed protein product [Clonostachys rhizophaga]
MAMFQGNHDQRGHTAEKVLSEKENMSMTRLAGKSAAYDADLFGCMWQSLKSHRPTDRDENNQMDRQYGTFVNSVELIPGVTPGRDIVATLRPSATSRSCVTAQLNWS